MGEDGTRINPGVNGGVDGSGGGDAGGGVEHWEMGIERRVSNLEAEATRSKGDIATTLEDTMLRSVELMEHINRLQHNFNELLATVREEANQRRELFESLGVEIERIKTLLEDVDEGTKNNEGSGDPGSDAGDYAPEQPGF